MKRRPAVGEASSSSRTLSDSPCSAASLLHLGDLLGGQFAGVLLLDLRQPLGALARLGLVDLDLAAVERLVDLLEEGVDELRLRDLPQRLAVGEDQALVLGAGDAEVGVRWPRRSR